MEKPICKIINDTFSWCIEVDGKNINFDGREEFIASVFESAGYLIEWDKDLWLRKENNENSTRIS